MPHASHRLDLIVAPSDPDRALDPAAVAVVRAGWAAAGLLDGSAPGPRRDGLIVGGFRRFWVDEPGAVVLYANLQGGFLVRCPQTEAPLARPFQAALTAFRRGGPRALRCPACGEDHALEALSYAPPALYARGALCFADVGDTVLQPEPFAALAAALGPLRAVVRRVP